MIPSPQIALKFGIIGCGRIGRRHAEHANNNGQVVACCDVDLTAATALAAEYPTATAYGSVGEMLAHADLDLVAICSPNGLHAEHSIAVLRAGSHVLCEKPMGISVYECGEMIKAAEQCNRRLFVVKQNRFNPPVAAVKKALDEGRLGKVYSIQLTCFWNRNNDYYKDSWKGSADLDGGTLFTQFSHFIDLLYWMFGDIKSVKGFRQNFLHQGVIDFEDAGVFAVEFYSGTIGTVNYSVNAFAGNMEGSLSILGEKGAVKIGGQYLNELEFQRIENYKIEGLPEGKPANNYGTYVGSMSNHDEVYLNIRQVLTEQASVMTNMFEGLKTVEIISKMYQEAGYTQRAE